MIGKPTSREPRRSARAGTTLPHRLLMLLVVLSACGTTMSHAVSLNPRGTGQVLIYPYYTVNQGQSTLLSLVNTTDQAKALKLHFREGYNGRQVLSFNLYLSPYDVWTGAIFTSSDTAGANFLTSDSSCTVPALRDNAQLPTLGDGRHYVALFKDPYSGYYQDSGPTEFARTREGWLEIVEMGELVGASAAAATHVRGVPKDCQRLISAWNGGYWAADPNVDMKRPGGGLYGALAVVNPAQGTIFEVAATALDGFSAYAQHTRISSEHPDLGDARSSPQGVDPPFADADVMLDSGVVHARYTGADRTIDAVSAVMMTDTITNEWVDEPAAGASTEWVTTFPTRRHYTDPALVRYAAQLPFSEMFGERKPGKAAELVTYDWTDRNGVRKHFDGPPWEPPPDYPFPEMFYNVTVVKSRDKSGSVLGSHLEWNSDAAWAPHSGTATIRWDPYSWTVYRLRPAQDGTVFLGFPVIGFGVVKYVNGNLSPGVLANYSAVTSHRSTMKCLRGNSPCG